MQVKWQVTDNGIVPCCDTFMADDEVFFKQDEIRTQSPGLFDHTLLQSRRQRMSHVDHCPIDLIQSYPVRKNTGHEVPYP